MDFGLRRGHLRQVAPGGHSSQGLLELLRLHHSRLEPRGHVGQPRLRDAGAERVGGLKKHAPHRRDARGVLPAHARSRAAASDPGATL